MSDNRLKLNLDCRYFIGEKPCKYNRLCEGCPHYNAFGTKILIIKLGAMGDVIRTTPVLKAIREQYSRYHLTWVVEPSGAVFLKGNPHIHRVIEYGLETLTRLMIEEFDVVISLDKSVSATALATLAKAPRKLGFGFHPVGNIYPFTPEADYSFSLGMSDQLKFIENTKTYQREMFDTLGYTDKEYGEYEIAWTNFDLQFGKALLERKHVSRGKYVIGLNTGAGEIFATKRYWQDHFVRLIHLIAGSMDATILLLGGPSEVERNRQIMESCSDVKALVDTGCDNSLRDFMGILNACDVVVTGDTLALHLVLALRKRVAALFGSTCDQEIDLYGLGEKLVARPECAPCYKKDCPFKDEKFMQCMKQITPEQVLDAIVRQVQECEGGRC
ncbi:MAG: glycosyltransferase family 9 protein [Candidatus Auribacter fodinae]|jgi:heptosyltransferase-2|uniref:Glycosyltransferase family 9 protein n=1 Tax=Candidatus Auribacter fodinae TaxID=2093366 RepID=A0A3A4R1I6_9BACT|nr:MAG: glycosyltransferase family 9 protein [Candidatus Auribacter fodinae]